MVDRNNLDDRYFPDIEQYLDNLESENKLKLKSKLLHKKIINKIISETNLTEFAAGVVIELFLQITKEKLLNQENVSINKFGTFSIAKTKRKNLKIKFTPAKQIIKKLNKGNNGRLKKSKI